MDKKFTYNFDSSQGILFKYYYGFINIEDIKSSWEYAFENGLIPKEVKGFILDYRNSNFNIKIEEYTEIVDFYKENLDIFGNYKIAILTEDPRDIVVPMLIGSQDEGYSSRPFSTLEAAVKWVLSQKKQKLATAVARIFHVTIKKSIKAKAINQLYDYNPSINAGVKNMPQWNGFSHDLFVMMVCGFDMLSHRIFDIVRQAHQTSSATEYSTNQD